MDINKARNITAAALAAGAVIATLSAASVAGSGSTGAAAATQHQLGQPGTRIARSIRTGATIKIKATSVPA